MSKTDLTSESGSEGGEGQSKSVQNEHSKVPDSDGSLGSYVTRLFEMHISWRRLQSAPRNSRSNHVLKVVQAGQFQSFINVAILLSAIQMGMAADLTGDDWDTVWEVSSITLTAIFAIEMCMKLVALGLSYFFNGWNVLDFFVAWSSIIDVWIIPALFGQEEDRALILKLFRLFRLLRIVKMLRVVPELMFVVEGMVASLRSMLWVFFLLGVILYAVSIYCVEAIGSESAGFKGWDNDVTIEETVVDTFNSFLYFGTVTRSMVSLFGVVILSEWSPVVRPVWEKQPVIVILFIGLVFLTTFGVLNVIIGVVVERTTDAMNQLRAKDVVKKKKEQTEAFRLITRLMFDLDTDCDKRVSKTEMEEGAENEQLHELLQKVDFPHGFTYGEFHAMLDQDGSGFLSRSEFINGMFRLVYNNEFQRDCMFQLTMGQIKANQYKLHRETKDYFQKLYEGIKREIDCLRYDVQSMRPRKDSGADSRHASEQQTSELDECERRTSVGSCSAAEHVRSRSSGLDLKSLFSEADLDNATSILVQPIERSSNLPRSKDTRSNVPHSSAMKDQQSNRSLYGRSVQFDILEGTPMESSTWESLKPAVSPQAVQVEELHQNNKPAQQSDTEAEDAKLLTGSNGTHKVQALGSMPTSAAENSEPPHGPKLLGHILEDRDARSSIIDI